MRSMKSSFARRALAPVFLASVFAACGPCDDGADGGDDGGLTSGSGGASASGTGTRSNGAGNDDDSSSGEQITVQSSTGTSCPEQTTCEAEGVTCGEIPDGCGNGQKLDCGTCEATESCIEGACVPTTCTPLTCADLGDKACGQASDGCGGLTEDCGSCSQPEVCGGGDDPSQCAVPDYCTGLCLQQVDCPAAGVTTTISGIVYAPGHVGDPAPPAPGSADPLFDALVYVPNGPVEPFQPNVQCSQCGEEASGDPLVFARTNAAGEFVLENVPVGDGVSIVIQLGRWRRIVPLPSITACVDNPLTQEQTRLPRNKSEGDIPHIAISTGDVDALECVLRKIGIDDSEFTNPNGTGRVKLYQGVGVSDEGDPGGGARIDGSTPGENILLDNPGELNQYDMVLFPCQGFSAPDRATGTRKQNLIDYTSLGGRIFSTHFSYDWMHDNGAFATVADWDVGTGDLDDQDGIIDQSFPKGVTFAQWLVNVGASTTLGLMPVKVVRQNVDSVNSGLAQQWMTTSEDAIVPLHLTFNTPVGDEPEDQCGRALYSDFHVANASTHNDPFPSECDNNPMTPQEKLVEFMLFDLGSCLTPDDPVCVPKTCEDLELECGPAPDGCNNIIDCGECDDGEICGGGGPGKCGGGSCEPKTCPQQGKDCGEISDQCGHIIDCGECAPGEICGGDGVANVCGDNVPD